MYFCLKIFFTFANSVDPDEMPHNVAFHLGLHCLSRVIIFFKIDFLSDVFFSFTNSVDPDEMPHNVAFHLGLHCL